MLFTTDSTRMSLRQARQLAGRRLSESGLPVDIEAVLMVLSELLTNAIQHTIEQTWRLSLFTSDNALVVEVADAGTTAPIERDNAPLDGSGGLGLGVVRKLSDYMETTLTNAGKTVSASWSLTPSPEGKNPRRPTVKPALSELHSFVRL